MKRDIYISRNMSLKSSSVQALSSVRNSKIIPQILDFQSLCIETLETWMDKNATSWILP
jgi:hypothetical protein